MSGQLCHEVGLATELDFGALCAPLLGEKERKWELWVQRAQEQEQRQGNGFRSGGLPTVAETRGAGRHAGDTQVSSGLGCS